MSRYYVVDTNVVVAGLLTAHADSPVARILDGMLSAAFSFVVSQALLVEYRCVLARPHLVRLHGLSPAEIDVLLTDLVRHAIVLNPEGADVAPRAPDVGDQFLWDLLASRSDLVLVTGDKLLRQDPIMGTRVMAPQDCVAQLWH